MYRQPVNAQAVDVGWQQLAATSSLMIKNMETDLAFFEANGYLVIPGAIKSDLADCIRFELQHIDQNQHKIGLLRRHLVVAGSNNASDPKFRFKDLYVNSKSVREAVFADVIVNTLLQLAHAPLLAFQNLGFIRGSGLRIHRDSNYIAMQGLNANFYGCWIALEDVEEGAGELSFFPQSHLLPHYLFADNSTHWVVSRDGIYANEACHGWLENQMASHGIQPEKFLARKGDCLIWHGDLVHAGNPILKPDRTRYSLVTHFCDAQSKPRYLQNSNSAQWVTVNERCCFSSAHYDLHAICTVEQLEGTTIRPRLPGSMKPS
jgi:ectoine hydroxylase-related dioxygenase (phytanoyl-CoA dioxygenase family)